jgi:anti-sigma factor RsiW
MTPEHLSSEQLSGYGQRALPPLELLAVDDHLAECDHCRARIAPAARTPETLSLLQDALLISPEGVSAHLDYEQLAGLVDGALPEAAHELAASHLDHCRACQNEFQDLSAFRAELAAQEDQPPAAAPVLATEPAAPSEAPVQVGYDKRRRGWWQRLKDKLFGGNDWARIEAVALVALLIALGVGLYVFSSRRQREQQVASQTNPPQPEPSALPPASTPAMTPTPAASPGLTPTPPTEPQYEAQLKDGTGLIALDPQGQLVGADGLPADLQQAVRTALTRQTLEVAPPPPELTGRAGTLMGGNADGVPFGLNGPLNTVSRSDRPAFRWQPLKDAESYEVTVFDQNFSPVVSSGKQTGTTWQPAKPLPRGNVYIWQVAAVQGGQEIISPTAPAPEAKFKILEADHHQAIEQAARLRSHLALGLAYARAGLREEATQEFNALLRANPDSPIARKLLAAMLNKAR